MPARIQEMWKLKDKNYRQTYENMTGRIRESGAACFALRAGDKAATGLIFISYPLLLALLAVQGSYGALVRAILIPGASFFILTALRAWINRPRPYETWNIDPIIKKDTRGNSLPSRHVFSSAVIAMAWLAFFPPVGAAFLFVTAAAAVIRVLGGVHYPSDVAAGFAFGVLAGVLLLF